MLFQREYEIICNLDTEQILQIAFNYNNSRVKIYVANSSNYRFLVVAVETSTYSFVKNFPFIPKDNSMYINGHWGSYWKYAKCLSSFDGKFNAFYDKLKNAIRNIENPTEDPAVSYSYVDKETAVKKIKLLTDKSPFKGETIYFNHIRREKMSKAQHEKVSKLLGSEVADHLRQSNLMATFTNDPTRQKEFILKLF